jgi:hypothetical protein
VKQTENGKGRIENQKGEIPKLNFSIPNPNPKSAIPNPKSTMTFAANAFCIIIYRNFFSEKNKKYFGFFENLGV